jgi:hypothetical protein
LLVCHALPTADDEGALLVLHTIQAKRTTSVRGMIRIKCARADHVHGRGVGGRVEDNLTRAACTSLGRKVVSPGPKMPWGRRATVRRAPPSSRNMEWTDTKKKKMRAPK